MNEEKSDLITQYSKEKTKKDKLNFIEAIIAIWLRDDLDFCYCEEELQGLYGSICVNRHGNRKGKDPFVGKLRWPREDEDGDPTGADIDEELLKELLKDEKIIKKVWERMGWKDSEGNLVHKYVNKPQTMIEIKKENKESGVI